jgi:hypothetical protein
MCNHKPMRTCRDTQTSVFFVDASAQQPVHLVYVELSETREALFTAARQLTVCQPKQLVMACEVEYLLKMRPLVLVMLQLGPSRY